MSHFVSDDLYYDVSSINFLQDRNFDFFCVHLSYILYSMFLSHLKPLFYCYVALSENILIHFICVTSFCNSLKCLLLIFKSFSFGCFSSYLAICSFFCFFFM